MAALPGRTLEPFANYIRLRDLPSTRFRLNVRHQWLRQSYRESLHETSVLHLCQTCKTTRRILKFFPDDRDLTRLSY